LSPPGEGGKPAVFGSPPNRPVVTGANGTKANIPVASVLVIDKIVTTGWKSHRCLA
jgi:hypothetical protein